MRRTAKVIVRLRFLVVPLWIAGAVLAFLYLPLHTRPATANMLGALLLPKDTPAVQAERLSKEDFPFPLITREVVVLHDRSGLPPRTLREATRTALAARQGKLSGLRGLAAVVPVPNVAFEPGARLTTVLYYLYIRPGADTGEVAHGFARQQVAPSAPDGAFVGVTGSRPAALARSNIIVEHLPTVTLATAVLIVLAVGLHFRSPVAPVVNLATVIIAYLFASHGLGRLGELLGFTVPSEAEPVIIVLLFGVVTDYSIFFLSRFQSRLAEGRSGRETAERASADVIGIVLAAGSIVALATASLIVARLSFFREFGPALAFTVLIGVLVAVTFVPGVLAIGGRFVLWPWSPGSGGREEERLDGRSLRARVVRLAVGQPFMTAVACALLLGAATSGLSRYELANPIFQDLPAGAGPHRAYTAATAGFPADGVLSPTVAVVREPGVANRPARLQTLKHLLARQPGVAAVLGPGDLGRLKTNAFVARDGDLARFLLIPRGDPLDGPAVDTVRHLQDRAPVLLHRAGLKNAELLFGGDTAIAAALVERTSGDFYRVTPVALVATALGLALFLRSLVAPVYLVAASVLALLAALGASAYLFEPLFDPKAISFFVPFATSILLLGLGSDYNVFLVGRVWDEARKRPLREAVQTAGTNAARPIATAGVILAASFGLLAFVPLAEFRTVALTMSLGLLLDAFIVRQLLVPALIVLVGRRSGWPGRALGRRPREQESETQDTGGDHG